MNLKILGAFLILASLVNSPCLGANAQTQTEDEYNYTLSPHIPRWLGVYASTQAQIDCMEDFLEQIDNFIPDPDSELKDAKFALDLTNVTIMLKHEWMEKIAALHNLKKIYVNFSSLERSYNGIHWPNSLEVCVTYHLTDVKRWFSLNAPDLIWGRRYETDGKKFVEKTQNVLGWIATGAAFVGAEFALIYLVSHSQTLERMQANACWAEKWFPRWMLRAADRLCKATPEEWQKLGCWSKRNMLFWDPTQDLCPEE